MQIRCFSVTAEGDIDEYYLDISEILAIEGLKVQVTIQLEDTAANVWLSKESFEECIMPYICELDERVYYNSESNYISVGCR